MSPNLDFEKAHGWPNVAIAGVDEAGRGALAGPVVAAAVIFSAPPPSGINDSKKLTPEQRTKLSTLIKQSARFALGVIAPARIDEINILRASLEAMALALHGLGARPELALIDGNHAPSDPLFRYETLVKGDARSLSIAAASILAKTHRDALMEEYEQEYPGYGFGQNRGYPTAHHRQALQDLGLTPIHRRSYAPVREVAALTPP